MTRSTLCTFSAVAVLALPLSHAFADDLFTLTGSNGTVISFTAPATPSIPPANTLDHYFFFQGIDNGGPNGRYTLPYTVDGQPTVTDEIDFFDNTYGGGLAIDGFGTGENFIQQEQDQTTPSQLFSGTTANPTFLLGTFNLTSAFPVCDPDNPQSGCVDNAENYTLTIADNSITTTPEPGSLVLLGSGILGGLATVRRRFIRA